MRPDRGGQDEWIELTLTRWLAVRAQGTGGILAAVLLVLWLTTLGFIYFFWHTQNAVLPTGPLERRSAPVVSQPHVRDDRETRL
jgi:hypothetical protein